jgi:hypothetical protein
MAYSDNILLNNMIDAGYPDLFSKYSQCSNFAKIYNDNNFWISLLRKDYAEIVGNNIFSKAKETYITLYNNLIDKVLPFARKIFMIYIDTINSDNLDLFKLLITNYIKSLNDGYEIVGDISTKSGCLREFVFKLGIQSKSYDIINYLLTVNEYIEIFLVYIVLTEYENLTKLFLNDINFDKSVILSNAILNDEIDTVKQIIPYINENKISDMIVLAITNDREGILLLLIKTSNNMTIKQSILKLIYNNNNSNEKKSQDISFSNWLEKSEPSNAK